MDTEPRGTAWGGIPRSDDHYGRSRHPRRHKAAAQRRRMMARALSWVRPAGLAALLLGAVARFACAQSLTAGTLSGTVSDSGGTSLADASITVSNHAGGLSWSASTPRDGRFVVPLLPPGAYDVLVERLGYRPKRVRDVPVRAGLVLDLPVALVPAPPPVEWTDSASFRGEAIQGSRAGISQWLDRKSTRLNSSHVRISYAVFC